MKSEQKRINRVKAVIGVIIVGLTMIIVCAIINATLSVRPLEFSNLDQINSSLSSDEIRELEKYLWQSIQESEGVSEVNQTLDALIRPSSYEEKDSDVTKNYSFLVDVDALKATYKISFAFKKGYSFYEIPDISCPTPELMKYSDTYCRIGRSSTTSATIGSYLPTEFRLDSGELVIVSVGYTEEGKDYLNVRVSSCGDDEIISQAHSEVKKWIDKHNFDSEQYEIKIPAFCDGEGR